MNVSISQPIISLTYVLHTTIRGCFKTLRILTAWRKQHSGKEIFSILIYNKHFSKHMHVLLIKSWHVIFKFLTNLNILILTGQYYFKGYDVSIFNWWNMDEDYKMKRIWIHFWIPNVLYSKKKSKCSFHISYYIDSHTVIHVSK